MRALLLASISVFAIAAGAQVPPSATRPAPPVDAAVYPNLAALQAFMQNGSAEARHCALTGGLFVDADRLLRENRTKPATVEALVARSKGQLKPDEVKRMRDIAAGVTEIAGGLRAIASENAAVAYSEICRASVLRVEGIGNESALQTRMSAASACDKQHPPGSLAGKECVAKAFRYP